MGNKRITFAFTLTQADAQQFLDDNDFGATPVGTNPIGFADGETVMKAVERQIRDTGGLIRFDVVDAYPLDVLPT